MFVDMKYLNNGDTFTRRGRTIGFDWLLTYLKQIFVVHFAMNIISVASYNWHSL